MLKHSRKLRFFKWAGLVGCVVLVGAWISNLWWQYALIAWGAQIGFVGGCIEFGSYQVSPSEKDYALAGSPGIFWLPMIVRATSDASLVILIPDWMFLAVLLPVTICLWRRDRIPPGHCKSCGYNLTGNISGRCSECGETIAERI